VWVPPEIKDPVPIHAPTRKLVACFGAVSLNTDKFVRAMCEKFDAVTFAGFLKRLLRHRSGETHGRRTGQRQVPPRRTSPALVCKLAHLIYGVVKSGKPFDANFATRELAIQDGI
jgi:hypothetical protein